MLLTGATGFVGAAAARHLLREGHALDLLVRDPARLAPDLACAGQVRILRGSLQALPGPAALAAEIDAVVHLAGLVDARRPRQFHEVNAAGAARLAAAVALAAPAARWVQVSSLAATGPGYDVADDDPPHPVSRYGASKLAGEAAVAAAGFPQRIVLRPPAVYGPGDRAFLPIFRDIARGRRVVLPRPAPARLSLIHVEDLAAALAAALAAPLARAGGRSFHVAGSEQPSLAEFLALAGEAVGRAPRVLRVPAAVGWALAAAVTPLRLATGRPAFLSIDKMRELTAEAWCCRSDGARAVLDWSPAHPLAEGLAQTVRHWRAAGFLP